MAAVLVLEGTAVLCVDALIQGETTTMNFGQNKRAHGIVSACLRVWQADNGENVLAYSGSGVLDAH